MKKWAIFWITFVIATVICACSSSNATYTINKNGISYVVNQENCTISDGTYSYHYSFSGNSSSYKIDITYPDGSAYWWQNQKSGNGFSSGIGGWSDDYDENRYVSGDILRDVLTEKAPRSYNFVKIFLSIFLMIVGILNASSPHTAWYLQYGWRYKNVEPSALALGLNRASGIIAIVFSVIIFFI